MTSAPPFPSAVITGASRGIGRATAEAFAARGFSVFLAADGTADELDAGIAACRTRGAPEAFRGIFDLGTPGQPEAMIAAARARLGRIDVLVNNAGIRCRKPFGQFTRADFDSVVSVNLTAAFFASQAVLPAMFAQGSGRIIHVASQFGTVSAPEHALYGLTKAALIHLARSMAVELGPRNILVNSVSPGPIATQFNLDRWSADPAYHDYLVSKVPARRPGTPEPRNPGRNRRSDRLPRHLARHLHPGPRPRSRWRLHDPLSKPRHLVVRRVAIGQPTTQHCAGRQQIGVRRHGKQKFLRRAAAAIWVSARGRVHAATWWHAA